MATSMAIRIYRPTLILSSKNEWERIDWYKKNPRSSPLKIGQKVKVADPKHRLHGVKVTVLQATEKYIEVEHKDSSYIFWSIECLKNSNL